MRFALASLTVVAFAAADVAADPIPVPYRRTDTQHILVRAKINGKGPFNFIIDTGAPAMFIADEVGKKLGLKTEHGWSTLARLDIEGGVKLDNVKVRVETPFQLEGMNGMNLAGAPLHGIIGYMVLAKFRMDIDLTRDKMLWTPLEFDPPDPRGLGGKGGGGQGGLEILGTVLKVVGLLAGRKLPAAEPRGFVGMEIDDDLTVRSVLADSPAAKAGIKSGDRIVAFNGRTVKTAAALQRQVSLTSPNQSLRLTVRRGDDETSHEITAGEGL